ncbi:DUF1033 family protein, partial [Streptococcus uberis]
MYGDWEPWWFIEGWQNDIVDEKEFDNWDEALAFYKQEWQHMKDDFPSYH